MYKRSVQHFKKIRMKKCTPKLSCSLLAVFLFSLFCGSQADAAPGDTTWVQAQNDVQLTYYNDYDAAVSFPTGAVTYRKIIMVFTLGKYQCPGTEQYCGDWDYTIQNYLFTPTDTIELSRLITPYANAAAPRTPWGWKQRYYYDVTDYYPLLKNSATIRLAYHNYSGGFTGNIRFAFIEGTPPRNVTGVSKLWEGSFNYGDATSIETFVPAKTLTAPANTQSAELKFTVTGHGSDNAGCSEFCSKYYQVKLNGATIDQKQLWKDNCGSNNLYPQSGTWVYNRANWCPGESILPFSHNLTGVTAGSNYSVDVDFESYTKSGTGTPSYTLSGYVVNYGAYNRTLDASLEEIISPSDYEGNYRSNPYAGQPVLRIKNTGATTISTVTFQYGIVGQTLQTYTVTGLTLLSMQQALVSLADLTALASMPTSSTNRFIATITAVNGSVDNEPLNNSLQSGFVTAPNWPNQFYIRLRTNNFPAQTTWKIQDLSGNILYQRTPTAALTFYNDLIGTLPNGAYKLTVTDANCDGLYWWANSGSTGLGAIFAQTADQSAIIPFTNGLPAVVQSGTSISVTSYSQDFGCGFTQYFRVGALLPVDFLSFSGKADSKSNHLYWETAKEINTKQFDIEFSATGTSFAKVGEVAANGNTSTKSSYSTLHTPAIVSDRYYYRLKMVDFDGSFKYSNIIQLKPNLDNFNITSIKPNPFTTSFSVTLTSIEEETVSFKLFDAQGRLEMQKSATIQKGINTINLDNLSGLPAGVHLLEINDGNQKLIQKLIKN